jgi:hypothetical protein
MNSWNWAAVPKEISQTPNQAILFGHRLTLVYCLLYTCVNYSEVVALVVLGSSTPHNLDGFNALLIERE